MEFTDELIHRFTLYRRFIEVGDEIQRLHGELQKLSHEIEELEAVEAAKELLAGDDRA